jgi:hypothetical protein
MNLESKITWGIGQVLATYSQSISMTRWLRMLVNPVKSRWRNTPQPYCTKAREHCLLKQPGVDSHTLLCLARAAGRPQTAETRQSGWRVFWFHRRHGAFSALFIISRYSPVIRRYTPIVKKNPYNVYIRACTIDKANSFIYGYFSAQQQLGDTICYFSWYFSVNFDYYKQSLFRWVSE